MGYTMSQHYSGRAKLSFHYSSSVFVCNKETYTLSTIRTTEPVVELKSVELFGMTIRKHLQYWRLPWILELFR